MFKDYPIQKFGSKLMVASQSINNIPNFFLSWAQNARIYDGGIGPRRGKTLLTDSTLGTENKGAFTMGGKLYQITNSKIYEINETTGVQTEKATLGYDAMTDIAIYDFVTEAFASLGSETHSYSYGSGMVYGIKYNVASNSLYLLESDLSTVRDVIPLTTGNTGYYKQSIKIIISTTTNAQAVGTGTTDGGNYVLQDGQYMELTAGILAGTINLQVGYYAVTNNSNALIGSNNKAIMVFNGSSIFQPVYQPVNSGILEYLDGYTFLAGGNILYISKRVTSSTPNNAYDWLNTGSQNIPFDTEIVGLKATTTGLYVFTKGRVYYIGSNSLQNVAGSATFISFPIGASSEPINNLAIASTGEKIFYLTKNLQIQTINYTPGVTESQIGELSARPVISITKLLKTLDTDQPRAFAWYNQTEKTLQFNVRTNTFGYNNYVIVYDLVNDTWNVDTGKNYNYVVLMNGQYYGFSDTNSSIYKDGVGFSDNGTPIDFKIRTQNIIIGPNQTMFGGFYIKGGIGGLTDLEINANIDGLSIFNDIISGEDTLPYLGEIGGGEIGEIIGGPLTYTTNIVPFDKRADQGRIFRMGNRIEYEITSSSQVQDFIIDMIGTTAEASIFTDINNKF